MRVSIHTARRLAPALAAAAQKVYDAWAQDEDGFDEALGSGGICQDIAEGLARVLAGAGIDAASVSSTHEQHVYVVAQVVEGVYLIDIPYSVYETGGGYTWRKIPDVVFEGGDVVFHKLDSDPDAWEDYLDS